MCAEYVVRLYSPFNPESTFSIRVPDSSPEEARSKALGTIVAPPGRPFEAFKVEDVFIISVYPEPTSVLIKRPPCHVMQPSPGAPLPDWLLGAWTDQPLCKGSRPFGTPYLVKTVTNSLTTLIFEQKMRSPEFPDVEQRINFKRDMFTPFLLEAKVKAPKDAIRYLLEHEGPLTAFQVSEALDIGYPTAEHNLKSLSEEGRITKTDQRYRGHILYYPRRLKSEGEKLFEIATMVRLKEHRELKVEEKRQIRTDIRTHQKEIERQTILPWLEEVEPKPVPKPTRIMETINIEVYNPETQKLVEHTQSIPVGFLDRMKLWVSSDVPAIADFRYDWQCEQGNVKYKDFFIVKCVAEVAGLKTQQYWLSRKSMILPKPAPPTPPKPVEEKPVGQKYFEFLKGVRKAAIPKEKTRIGIVEKSRVKVRIDSSEFEAAEETISSSVDEKLSWAPSRYTIADPKAKWTCVESPYNDLVLVKCVAETPERSVKYFYRAA